MSQRPLKTTARSFLGKLPVGGHECPGRARLCDHAGRSKIERGQPEQEGTDPDNGSRDERMRETETEEQWLSARVSRINEAYLGLVGLNDAEQ